MFPSVNSSSVAVFLHPNHWFVGVAYAATSVWRFQGDDKKKDEEKEKEEEEEKLKKIKDTNKLEDKELLVKMCKCKLVTQGNQRDGEQPNPADNIKNNQEKGGSAQIRSGDSRNEYIGIEWVQGGKWLACVRQGGVNVPGLKVHQT